MPRNYSSEITISQHGRAYGVQFMSSAKTGSTRDRYQFISGPDEYRVGVSTAETTGVNLHPFGVSLLTTGTSRVFTLNPPVPGVAKTIYTTGTSISYVKTRNGETIESSKGTTQNTMIFTSHSFVQLVGLTTGRWLVTGMPLTTGTLGFATST